MERAIKERMTNAPDIETVMPNDLVNPKPASLFCDREFLDKVNFHNLWIKPFIRNNS